MSKPTVEPRSRVYLTWRDSVGGSGWERPDDAIKDADSETMLVHTAGWLLKETDDWLLVVGSQMDNGGSILAPLQIPKSSIVTRDSWRKA